MAQYYLPPATELLLTKDAIDRCKNLGLILDKYPTQRAIENSEAKTTWLKAFERDNHIDGRLVEEVHKRWRSTTAAMGAQHFTAATQWRLVVGLGGETALETDLTLHYLYGIPFIPGSALKGLTRAFVTSEIEEHKSKKIETDDAVVQHIFGTQKDAGHVIFFDAMPVDGKIELDLDIMNAHYPKYYGEKQLPTNNQNPNPVTFLTVTNTTFAFALAPRRPDRAEDVEATKQAKTWLQLALQKYGVGGKTSAGYGYFVIEQQEETTVVSPTQSPVAAKQPASDSYVRPNIPKFTAGQGLVGNVVAATEELRSSHPDAHSFLQFRSFSLKYVLIVVKGEEAADWTPGQQKNCLFVSEEECNGCTVLICKPGVNKSKGKKS